MKKVIRKSKGLVRGVPSAVLLSILIHVALLLAATFLVVFTAKERKEKKFVPPPPVVRPKMDLIKPKVRIKNQPRAGAPTRITTKAQPQGLPEMSLPSLKGMGEGIGSGVGGFDMMPDLAELSIFGGKKSMSAGNDFEGTFYSLAYERDGSRAKVDTGAFWEVIRRFVESGWNPYVFTPYFRGPQKLYTSQIFIPLVTSEFGPSYFGVPDGPDFDPWFWLVHYKGKIMRKEGGRFRFWGVGDNAFLVRVNGEFVFDGTWQLNDDGVSHEYNAPDEHFMYPMAHGLAAVGKWFELEPGVPVEMEVLIGEETGVMTCAYLVVQEEGEEYSENRDGLPCLPVLKTAEIPRVVKDKINYSLIPGEADLDSDLMFNVY
jgi:hypothetical protein